MPMSMPNWNTESIFFSIRFDYSLLMKVSTSTDFEAIEDSYRYSGSIQNLHST